MAGEKKKLQQILPDRRWHPIHEGWTKGLIGCMATPNGEAWEFKYWTKTMYQVCVFSLKVGRKAAIM